MRRLTFLLACVLTVAASAGVSADSVDRGDRGPAVQQVQEHLRWFGYSVQADGVFGAQTERAVRHWQTVNGLTVDGIVGPVTAGSLGIRGAQITLTAQPAPPDRPPSGLDDCAEMSWYRQQAGLPVEFDALGKRESNCRNEESVRTWCCYGWWQNYIGSHLSKGSAYRQPIIEVCGVTGAADIDSDTAGDKRRQACVTKVLYDISGFGPWKL